MAASDEEVVETLQTITDQPDPCWGRRNLHTQSQVSQVARFGSNSVTHQECVHRTISRNGRFC